MRAFYSANIDDFLKQSDEEILGTLAKNNTFSLEDTQRNAWLYQIRTLKIVLKDLSNARIIFEYTIPRNGKRVDVILLYAGIIFVIEFKVGEAAYSGGAKDQVMDYALDLKNFHKESHERPIAPILISTNAQDVDNHVISHEDGIFDVSLLNDHTLTQWIYDFVGSNSFQDFDYEGWENSSYSPTPTIIEAAQALYLNHTVEDISRSDSGVQNLTQTSNAINEIISHSKNNHKKSICFITGVPGSGKTLAGLNIANSRHNFEEDEHAVFLSGNGPLVSVLRESLTRCEIAKSTSDKKIKRKDAERKVSAFIQNIHHFRDDYLDNSKIPTEKVVIFDEAQRAWTKEQASSFMSRKKRKTDFDISEPEFLISIMDRRADWACIVCLIGGGQEINTGEAGLSEWFSSLRNKFTHWDIYVSDNLKDSEYNTDPNVTSELNLKFIKDLHLKVSIRSFRSERVSELIKEILDGNIDTARNVFAQIKENYPIYFTRRIETAKNWLRKTARGNERYGIIASSNSMRLKPYGIFSQLKIDAPKWFLNNKSEINSSYFTEDVATEFDVQGLELDWTCVAWDADMRYENNEWVFKNFRGTKWQQISKDENKLYKKNSYRVLLTRARQGMVLFIPKGDYSDETRLPKFYNGIVELLKSIGIEELS